MPSRTWWPARWKVCLRRRWPSSIPADELLNRPRAQGDGEAQLAEANLDYRRQVESELLAKINAALGPLLGPDRFRASVNADCDFSSSEENEETVDPDQIGRADLADHGRIERRRELAGGTPGTASNLPRPTARAAPAGRRPASPNRKRLLPAQPHREAHDFAQGHGAANFDRRLAGPDRALGRRGRQSAARRWCRLRRK